MGVPNRSRRHLALPEPHAHLGSPLVFPVVEEHGDWLRVMIPARPNQQGCRVDRSRDDVTIKTHSWHIEVYVTANRMRVWQGDVLEDEHHRRRHPTYTRTPLGRFLHQREAQEQPNSYGAYGSWILATNGFSDVMERFPAARCRCSLCTARPTPRPWARTSLQRLHPHAERDRSSAWPPMLPVGTPVVIVAESLAGAAAGSTDTSLATAA